MARAIIEGSCPGCDSDDCNCDDEHDWEFDSSEEEQRQQDYVADMKMDQKRLGEGNEDCKECFGTGDAMGAGDEFGQKCWLCGGSGKAMSADDDDMDEVASLGVDEGFVFDKFVDQILISEGYGRAPVKPEDNPQRRRAARHQDRPGNKTRFGGNR